MKSIILLNTNLPNNPPQERTKILDKTQIVFLKTPFSEFNGISLIRIVVHNCWSQFWKLLFGDRNLYSRFLKFFKGSRHMLQKKKNKEFFSTQNIYLSKESSWHNYTSPMLWLGKTFEKCFSSDGCVVLVILRDWIKPVFLSQYAYLHKWYWYTAPGVQVGHMCTKLIVDYFKQWLRKF